VQTSTISGLLHCASCAQENDSITLEVANDFCEVWLKDNYMGLLQDVIALSSGRQLQIKSKWAQAAGLPPYGVPSRSRQEEGDRACAGTSVETTT